MGVSGTSRRCSSPHRGAVSVSCYPVDLAVRPHEHVDRCAMAKSRSDDRRRRIVGVERAPAMALETAAASDRLDPSMRFRMVQPLRNSDELASSATEAANDEGHKTKRFDNRRLPALFSPTMIVSSRSGMT